MEYFQVMYDSRVVIYKRKMFIRLATDGWIYLVTRRRWGLHVQQTDLWTLQAIVLYSKLHAATWNSGSLRNLNWSSIQARAKIY